MEENRKSGFYVGDYWSGWRRWAAWLICLGTATLLGTFRVTTDAEFAFASFALVPVLVISWIGGRKNGLTMAFLATAMWILADILTDRNYSTAWVPWANATARVLTYSLVAFLTAQVRERIEREHERASHDVLTGLQNRRAFFADGASEVARSKRYQHSLAVVFLDLDDFKLLNDMSGHDAGDAALRSTAIALLGTLRSSDRVARLGGDEFSVLLPEIGYEAAVDTGRRIFVAVKDALRDFPPVKLSIGVAWFGKADLPFPAMLKAADELMYEVKQTGKDDMRSRCF